MIQVLCAFFLFQTAQTGTLTGKVTDESGAVVPKAMVVLAGPAGPVKTASSGDNGSYSFAGLTPGEYSIQASAPDLAMAQAVKITLKAGAQVLNVQLKVAATVQQVTVRENVGPAVSTEAASNASALVLKGDDLDALGDDPEDLQADLQALAGPSAGPNGGSIFIDGFSGGDLPPKSAIREIRINQNPFSPEYDKLGFGRIEIFTKPGSDNWRGNIQYNLQDQIWNSRNPYSPQKAPLLLNELEGSVSGPLNHRTSFTLDGQREKVDNGSIVNGVTVDPGTFAVVPLSAVRTTPQMRVRVTPRVDYQLNQNNTLMFRYAISYLDIQDAGIGSFDMISRGYHLQNTNHTVQATETAVLGASVNETRFQYYRNGLDTTANSSSPALLVLGAFNGGGAQTGQASNIQNNYELQNYTSMIHGAHSWRFGGRYRLQQIDSVSPQNFGGTFTFGGGLAPVLDANNNPVLNSSGQPVVAEIQPVDRYRRSLLLAQVGLPPAQIASLGGGPTQFSINAGIPGIAVRQQDVGLFVGDDWRVRPNLTLNLGLRFEAQTNIHDLRDWAPRIGLAWAPGAKSLKPKTVIRVGFGMFYDRFALANTLTADRFNGKVQQQYVVTGPTFYPNIPSLASLASSQSPQVIQEVSSQLRAPYIMQSAFSVERQLPANTTLAVTYTNSHGLHELRSEDINAPLPGTGVYPFGTSNPLFLMTSSGLYNQNQVMFNVNTKVNPRISLYGFYVLNRAMSNTDGLNTYPGNPYNFTGEYGNAATDVHNRVNIGGSMSTKWNLRFSPYISMQSGAPFDITTGSDPFGTTLFNARPGIVTSMSVPSAIETGYGLLDPNPTANEKLLPRNYGRGPGMVNLNLRIGKTWGFGSEGGKPKVVAPTGPVGPPNPGGPGAPNNGGGIAGVVSNTAQRYKLTVSLSFRNLTNHNNPGPIIGNITSPLFGFANQSAGSGGGSGISESANNRRTELQIRFTF
ncbi:MAG TPA: carboxypeptidase regulatory-like domain-containing protein [Bryobacteraceae bacterium]|nr:carboxypeptidase regulatory-like domain-containing protein [Bryobacteraceae bacterium]